MRDHEVGWNADKALCGTLECQPGDHPTAIKFNDTNFTQVFALDEMAERAQQFRVIDSLVLCWHTLLSDDYFVSFVASEEPEVRIQESE
jgi:hypothetical protein